MQPVSLSQLASQTCNEKFATYTACGIVHYDRACILHCILLTDRLLEMMQVADCARIVLGLPAMFSEPDHEPDQQSLVVDSGEQPALAGGASDGSLEGDSVTFDAAFTVFVYYV